MKFIFVLIILLKFTLAFGDDVQINLEPQNPVLGESFNVIFKIITKNGDDPQISFNPSSGLEVTGRQQSGVTTSTTYINGNLSVERSVSISYEVIASKAGSQFLRDINVEIGGQVIKRPNFRINVVSEREAPKDILAIAEVDKTSAYVGESILVRYYLYNKVTINSTDIKTFPKLDKFLKRYHQEKMTAERVNYEGSIYTRRVLYTAQLFADKPGTYKIDPITLSVQYLQNSSGTNSLGYGFGFRQQRSLNIVSKSIPIEIKSLPSEAVPPHFTGLVGKHEFKLVQNKQKFLINDPIELKLTVKGPGALELFEAPKLLKNDAIEEFESSADLTVGNDFNATKAFDLTLLGRAALEMPATKIPLSYFDPTSQSYVTEYIELLPISIIGQNVSSIAKGNDNTTKETKNIVDPVSAKEPIDLTPIYTLSNTYIHNSRTINTIILVLVLLLTTIYGKNIYKMRARKIPNLYYKIKNEGLNYGTLVLLLSKISEGKTLKESVENCELSKVAKQELLRVLKNCEDEYKKLGKSRNHKIKKVTLKEIAELLKDEE